MFNLKPSDVHVVFIVHPNQKDNFLEWFYTLGFQWIRWDWKKFQSEMEQINTIAIESNDSKLYKLIDKLNEPANNGKMFWFVGCNDLLQTVNYFAHFLYNRKDEWKDFDNHYLKVYGTRFTERIKQLHVTS